MFLHAASTDTKYVGALEIGFLAQDAVTVHSHPVNHIVPAGSDPIGVSVTGNLRERGTYYVKVELTAAADKGSGPVVPVKARIRVDVK